MIAFLLKAKMFNGLIVWSNRKFINLVALFCPEDIVYLSPSPSSALILFTFLVLQSSLSFGGKECYTVVPFMAEHCSNTYCEHFDHLWIFVLTTTHKETYMVTYNHMQPQFQGIQHHILAFKGTRHVWGAQICIEEKPIHTHVYDYNQSLKEADTTGL